MTTPNDDFYVAIALVESGLIANPETAIEFSANLAVKDFSHGISIGSRSLRDELLRAGREKFIELMKPVRAVLCDEKGVRFLTRASAELVMFIVELLVSTHGVSIAVATLCARVVVNEGLEAFCRGTVL